jgi:hypothetical protein
VGRVPPYTKRATIPHQARRRYRPDGETNKVPGNEGFQEAPPNATSADFALFFQFSRFRKKKKKKMKATVLLGS